MKKRLCIESIFGVLKQAEVGVPVVEVIWRNPLAFQICNNERRGIRE
jgi:hypothetical protein